MKWRGALIIIMLSAERWRSAFFRCVPELVGTFHWHCYPACFLRPAAFVSLSPIVPASFVPWLQQWLFSLPLNIYVHFLPLCVLFVLFCCLLCLSFLLLQSWEIAQAHMHKPELICSLFTQTSPTQPVPPSPQCLLLFTVTHTYLLRDKSLAVILGGSSTTII